MAQCDLESILKSESTAHQRTKQLHKKSNTGKRYDIQSHILDLQINPAVDSMNGLVQTRLKVKANSVDEIEFDLRANMVVDSVLVGNKRTTFARSGDVLIVRLPKTVNIGDQLHITTFYKGNPTNNPYNSYVREKRRPRSEHPVLWTLSEPYGAHAWWPCKESLLDKIDSVDIIVTVPNGNRVASNGLLIDSVSVNDSQTRYHWKHRYPIVTYLVAFSVSDYASFVDHVHWSDGDSMEILNYLFPESVPSSRNPAKETVSMMHLFDSLFGPYPFKKEKYGHAQMLRSGGMEHQTMSFMSGLNYGLVAHELAHQWFGDQVTCATWSDLWLNEGFATYLSYLAFYHLKPEDESREELISIRNRAMRENSGSVFVADTLDEARLFSGRLTYAKGALLLRMLQWKLGDVAFFNGVRNYLTDPKLSYGSAYTSDLIRHLEASSNQNLSEFFADWFYGEGYPNFTVRWGLEDGLTVLNISQTGNSTVDYFEIPLQLRFMDSEHDTLIRVEENSLREKVRLNLGFKPDSMEFDPNLWVMARAQTFKESDIFTNISVYPNPVLSNLSVRHKFSEIYEIKAHGIDGRAIRINNWTGQRDQTEVSLPDLASGMYVLEIIGDLGTIRSKFFKILP